MTSHAPRPLFSSLTRRVLVYALLTIGLICLVTLPSQRDYVGGDNDDAMRLVEVRDYLAGQGWFDLMQYRLGLPPGILMHWSRLIDWPIATLIRLCGLFFRGEQAEAVALALWPLLLTLPVLAAFAYAGERLGGRVTSHVMLLLTLLYLVSSNRFLPGAIDHHNAQIGLVAIMAAVVVTRPGWMAYGVAGVAAALALGIGAETTPLVAVVCALVALQWALAGRAMQGQAMAFSLALSLGVTAVFTGTIPAERYMTVTCDALSFGFYGLATLGAGLLFLGVLATSGLSRGLRLAVLALIGLACAAAAKRIAPQCLGNPLAELDPMLVKLWLDKVGEARSFWVVAQSEPEALAAFYASGLLALCATVFKLWRGGDRERQATMGLLVLASFAVALVQVRGTMFSSLLAILPLGMLIADLRQRHRLAPQRPGPALAFVLATLTAPSAGWAMMGSLWSNGWPTLQSFRAAENASPAASRESCFSREALAPLAALAPTTVVADIDGGSPILRFTPHRVLAAPYHRNQRGMLTELYIGLSTPDDARALLRGADVGIIAFCHPSVLTEELAALKPDGLYAQLTKGNVPDYLQPLPSAEGLKLYAVKTGQ
ncbi:hypothetical protein ACQ3G6_16655 [Allorhizobium undicola]|uniref:hypothetical protein n=1 Tax=Allorhizobium undicola TaxID=78527 RepID=UPI003D32E713